MSVANKEEVFTHPLVLRLGKPTVGVPIKKRPVALSDSSSASSAAPMKSLTSALEEPVSAEFSFNSTKQGANVMTKGKGIINSQIADHANRSFTLPMTNNKGVLLDGSNGIPTCAEVDRSTAQVDELKIQKFPALDLQLASCRHGRNNYGSAIKKEKVDQCFSGFHLAQPHKNVQIASEINASSNISFGKLPNLDLNVPPEPVDSNEVLPAMNESRKGKFHGSIDYQNAQLPTISSGPARNIDSLNLSNTYRPSQKCGPDDVTLDLQLKPPARPEIGKNWKGLAPAPELSLSLSGTSLDEPAALSAPGALFNSEPALSLKIVSKEAATLGSNISKSTVEEAVACKAIPQNTSPTLSGTDKIVSNNMVKKEPEEPSLQHTLDDVEKTRLLEQQSIRQVNNCAGYEKTDNAPQVPSKTQFDLNSNAFPNSSIHNGHGTSTDNETIPGPCLSDTVPTEVMPVAPDKVQKSVKREEPMSNVPGSAVASVSSHAALILMAPNSLHSDTNVGNCAVGSCEPSIQPLSSPSEPSLSSTVCKPPASHLNAHEGTPHMPGEALQWQSSSNPIAEPSVHNSRGYTANDGTSQGSAEMDCSDDDDNTAFRLPSADRPQCGPSKNGQATEDGINVGKLCKEQKREPDSDMRQDCSSVTNKVSVGDVNEHQREVSIGEESKDNWKMDSTKNNMHDVKTATDSCSTDLQRSLALQIPASSNIAAIKQFPTALDICPKKTRSLDIKSETSLSAHAKLAASSSEDCAKNAAVKVEHGAEIDEAASENSNEKSKPDSYTNTTSSVSNEKDGQLVGPHRTDLGYAYVNRNERWERFMESEQQKTRGGYQDGRHGPDVSDQRRTDHRCGGHGTVSRVYQRNFRGPRMSNDYPFENDHGHLHRIPHRRRHSPPAVCGRERDIDIDDFPGRDFPDPRLLAHDSPDDMIQERFFRPHSHRRNAQGDHGFVHRDRSHSPAQRRGAPVHFHRGRSPEALHRSPPLLRTERTCLTHRCPTRRHGSPLDRIGHDERGMQRNTRRCGTIGSHRVLEGDDFDQPLHPAHVAGLHAEEELVDRRKYRYRRAHRRSLEEGLADDDEMLSYHLEEEIEFAECGRPQELDGRLKNRMGHRMRREQEDSSRHRGPQGWDSNDNRPKRRRY